MKLKFRVDLSTEAEILQALNDLEGDVSVQDIQNPKSSNRRQSQGIEPFTYFVVVFAAHLTAGATHDVLAKVITKRLAQKNAEKIDIENVDIEEEN